MTRTRVIKYLARLPKKLGCWKMMVVGSVFEAKSLLDGSSYGLMKGLESGLTDWKMRYISQSKCIERVHNVNMCNVESRILLNF